MSSSTICRTPTNIMTCQTSFIWAVWLKQNSMFFFCGDLGVCREWLMYERFDPNILRRYTVLKWPGISTTCHVRVWIKGMNHIPQRCMDHGYGWGLWSPVCLGYCGVDRALHLQPWPFHKVKIKLPASHEQRAATSRSVSNSWCSKLNDKSFQ